MEFFIHNKTDFKLLDVMRIDSLVEGFVSVVKIVFYTVGSGIFIAMLIYTVLGIKNYKNKVKKSNGKLKTSKARLITMIVLDCLLLLSFILFIVLCK